MKKRKLDTSNVASEVLDFLIDYAASTRGAEIELAARLSKRIGKPVFRQQVQGWLNPDPKKRIEPKLGVGLLMISEGNQMITDQTGVVLNVSSVIAKIFLDAPYRIKMRRCAQSRKAKSELRH